MVILEKSNKIGLENEVLNNSREELKSFLSGEFNQAF